MPYNASPATTAYDIALWVFSVHKSKMVERKKELVTVGFTIVESLSGSEFSFSICSSKNIPSYVHCHDSQSHVRHGITYPSKPGRCNTSTWISRVPTYEILILGFSGMDNATLKSNPPLLHARPKHKEWRSGTPRAREVDSISALNDPSCWNPKL